MPGSFVNIPLPEDGLPVLHQIVSRGSPFRLLIGSQALIANACVCPNRSRARRRCAANALALGTIPPDSSPIRQSPSKLPFRQSLAVPIAPRSATAWRYCSPPGSSPSKQLSAASSPVSTAPSPP
jgi:hypothetical protein